MISKNILSIECSGKLLSFAVQIKNVLHEKTVPPGDVGHAEKLLPELIQFLEEKKVTLDDIHQIIISRGPGSYTSLRVGLASAIGLMWDRPIELFSVSSLENLSRQTDKNSSNKNILPFIAAGRGQYYAALYESGKWIQPEQVVTEEILKEWSQNSSALVLSPHFSFLKDPSFFKNKKEASPLARTQIELHVQGESKTVNPQKPLLSYLQEPDLG